MSVFDPSKKLVPRAQALAEYLRRHGEALYFTQLDDKFGSDARFAAEELGIITYVPGRPGWYFPGKAN